MIPSSPSEFSRNFDFSGFTGTIHRSPHRREVLQAPGGPDALGIWSQRSAEGRKGEPNGSGEWDPTTCAVRSSFVDWSVLYPCLVQAEETPLHIAARIKGGEKVAEMLIKSGADVNAIMDVSTPWPSYKRERYRNHKRRNRDSCRRCRGTSQGGLCRSAARTESDN